MRPELHFPVRSLPQRPTKRVEVHRGEGLVQRRHVLVADAAHEVLQARHVQLLLVRRKHADRLHRRLQAPSSLTAGHLVLGVGTGHGLDRVRLRRVVSSFKVLPGDRHRVLELRARPGDPLGVIVSFSRMLLSLLVADCPPTVGDIVGLQREPARGRGRSLAPLRLCIVVLRSLQLVRVDDRWRSRDFTAVGRRVEAQSTSSSSSASSSLRALSLRRPSCALSVLPDLPLVLPVGSGGVLSCVSDSPPVEHTRRPRPHPTTCVFFENLVLATVDAEVVVVDAAAVVVVGMVVVTVAGVVICCKVRRNDILFLEC
mmetsp:Transcript_48541/g.152239  ORF Transcript_48541/g.152239 Transcript_48541/m.152239 type:complete len:314 (+) Transcript_48541:1068-2009(+)